MGTGPGLRTGLLGYGAADVDQIVGDHAEPNPAFDAGLAFVSAAVQSMSPLDHADAVLGAGPPPLPVAEPALLLLALCAPDSSHALDAFGVCGGLVFA